jgi:hypothetical protein
MIPNRVHGREHGRTRSRIRLSAHLQLNGAQERGTIGKASRNSNQSVLSEIHFSLTAPGLPNSFGHRGAILRVWYPGRSSRHNAVVNVVLPPCPARGSARVSSRDMAAPARGGPFPEVVPHEKVQEIRTMQEISTRLARCLRGNVADHREPCQGRIPADPSASWCG